MSKAKGTMAKRRELPYFPLYVDAFISDEKLNECSAQANGIYIRLLCLMHKSEDYGKIYVGDKSVVGILCKQMPYKRYEIERGLAELLKAGVVYLEDGYLCQKRMIRDARLSEMRSDTASIAYIKYIERVQEQIPMPKRLKEDEEPMLFQDKPEMAISKMETTKTKRYTALEFKHDIMELGVSEAVADTWMVNRRNKKLPNTKLAFEMTKKELLSHPEYTPEEQLKTAAANGWGGYKFKWFYNEIIDGNDKNNTSSAKSALPPTQEPRNYDEGF